MLLAPGNVQEEFDDSRSVPMQVLFKMGDRPITIMPDAVARSSASWNALAAENFRMDSDDQHLFIIGAIKDANLATLG